MSDIEIAVQLTRAWATAHQGDLPRKDLGDILHAFRYFLEKLQKEGN